MIHLYERRNGQEVEPLPLEELKDWFYKVEITKKSDSRSIRQNSLLHAWLSQIERESHVWYTAEEWKEEFRSAFLQTKVGSKVDRRKKTIRLKSTAELSTVEFNDFLEKIRTAALTSNVWPIRLLYPDQVSFEAWIKTFD